MKGKEVQMCEGEKFQGTAHESVIPEHQMKGERSREKFLFP